MTGSIKNDPPATGADSAGGELALVVPFYNEERRVEFFEQVILEYASRSVLPGQLVMVDDGSHDNTLEALQRVADDIQAHGVESRVLSCGVNRGKGGALKLGVATASRPWVLTLDADLAAHPVQVDRWLAQGCADLDNRSRVYVGDRELGRAAGLVKCHLHRRLVGRVFASLVKGLTGLAVADTQCGFKLYPRQMAQRVFADLEELRFGHDVEILCRLRLLGAEVVALPVEWTERGQSSVRVLRDGFEMLGELLRISSRLCRSSR